MLRTGEDAPRQEGTCGREGHTVIEGSGARDRDWPPGTFVTGAASISPGERNSGSWSTGAWLREAAVGKTCAESKHSPASEARSLGLGRQSEEGAPMGSGWK